MREAMREVMLGGLGAAGDIVVDRWGIAHLVAASLDDLWFLQGFNAARDRLWQIDLWRKRGLGRLAADFGPGFLEQDKAARAFLYRGDMQAEWAAYAPDAKAICERFVDGINAFIALCEREPELLPPEFSITGTRPENWAAQDVVRIRSHGLTRNALWELQRLNVLARADARTDSLRKWLEPPVEVKLPKGLPGSLGERPVPMAALDVFRLAQANVTFTPERMAARLDEAGRFRKVSDLNEVLFTPDDEGSNNWAVHGSRSRTGLPIMGSDPHRAHGLPSLRYLVHLTAPGFDAIGAGEPCVPGLSFGHNGEVAFSMTIFGADQEDVFIYETDPADPLRYVYGDGFEAMSVVRESFAVKGEADQVHEIAFTRHGPVIWRDRARHLALAVRSVWFEPGSAPYMASLSVMRARSLEEFKAAAARWGAPSGNLLYAGRDGHIAWTPVGHMPIRPNWKGLTPVPGDGSHEWQGLRAHAELPFVVDPPEGFLATANEMNLPADWPHADKPIGFEWTERSRATRVHEVLAGEAVHTIAASRALQTDVLSVPARRMGALLAGVEAPDADSGQALALLAGWDFRLEAGSAAAALFEVWWSKHLKPTLFARLAPDPAVRALLAPGDVEGMLRALEHPDSRFGPDPRRARDALLTATLAAAWRDLRERLGPDASGWAWGALHKGYFEHPLTALVKHERGTALDIGPVPKGGSASTPMHTGYRPSDFRIVMGSSFRMVVDLADLDRSVCVNAPGQSGDPRSPHYADLTPLWAAGDYVPMLHGRAAVEAAAESRWRLVPAPGGG
jgi:penicillin amidase